MATDNLLNKGNTRTLRCRSLLLILLILLSRRYHSFCKAGLCKWSRVSQLLATCLESLTFLAPRARHTSTLTVYSPVFSDNTTTHVTTRYIVCVKCMLIEIVPQPPSQQVCILPFQSTCLTVYGRTGSRPSQVALIQLSMLQE